MRRMRFCCACIACLVPQLAAARDGMDLRLPLPSWVTEDERRFAHSVVQALVSRGVARSSISTNSYVFEFSYKGWGARFYHQESRFVGVVYASFQEMLDDVYDQLHIGRILADEGNVVKNVSTALKQVEVGGLQEKTDYRYQQRCRSCYLRPEKGAN